MKRYFVVVEGPIIGIFNGILEYRRACGKNSPYMEGLLITGNWRMLTLKSTTYIENLTVRSKWKRY